MESSLSEEDFDRELEEFFGKSYSDDSVSLPVSSQKRISKRSKQQQIAQKSTCSHGDTSVSSSSELSTSTHEQPQPRESNSTSKLSTSTRQKPQPRVSQSPSELSTSTHEQPQPRASNSTSELSKSTHVKSAEGSSRKRTHSSSSSNQDRPRKTRVPPWVGHEI